MTRYLTGREKDNFIDLTQARLDLATTCLKYLCFDCFDPDLQDKDVQDNLLSGAYRLYNFATSLWAGLTKECARNLQMKALPEELIVLLERFIDERRNDEYDGPSEKMPKPCELIPFKGWPELHYMLCRALEFRRRQLNLGDWRLDEGRRVLSLMRGLFFFFKIHLRTLLAELTKAWNKATHG
jgi:hypothetical protein